MSVYCNECGKQLSSTAKFCGACGTKVGGASSAQSVHRESGSKQHQNSSNSGMADAETAKYIYILYCLGYFTGGLTFLAGALWAYQKSKQASSPIRSHFEYQISTFWKTNIIGLGFAALLIIQLFAQMALGPFSIVMALTGFGVLLLGLVACIYLGIRTFKGFQLLNRQISNPKCWWLPTAL